MKTTHFWLLLALSVAAVAIRLDSLPTSPFFCDVPDNVEAIATGSMRIQFPGYVPFHLLANTLVPIIGNPFRALVFLSVCMGIGAWTYITRLGMDRWGTTGAMIAFLGMGISPLAVYLSVIGASYTTDMLAAAAMLFHGNRFLRDAKKQDFYAALAWFAFGVLMRPLSFMFTGLAVCYLLWQNIQKVGWSVKTKRLCIITLASGIACILAFLAISLPYYDSLGHFVRSTQQTAAELQATTHTQLITNTFRLLAYPMWGLHIFLSASLYWIIKNRKALDIPFTLFCVSLAAPYTLILIRYIPHSAYYALLLPVLTTLPMLTKNRASPNKRQTRIVFGCLSALFMAQWFLAKPVPTTNSSTLVANAYFLQYSRAGIRQDMFETLTSLSRKTGILTDRIPHQR